jgi:transcriptional regulator with GAF, ATPase, and Fis domain
MGDIARRVGRFELADGGTIFLDEIGELPADAQAKEREFERIGGSGPIRVDVRVLAATNRDLLKSVREKMFREDPYYRLSVFPVQLPPLRDRQKDIPALVLFLVNKFAMRIGKRKDGVDKETMQRLLNVRELENVIGRSIILVNGSILHIGPDILPLGSPAPALPGSSMQGVERNHILSMLRQMRGVIGGPRGAARILNLHPNTLRSRMKKLGIGRNDRTES